MTRKWSGFFIHLLRRVKNYINNRLISIKSIQNHRKYLLFLNIQVKVRLHIQYKFNSEIRFLKSFLKVIKSSKTFLKVMTLQLNFLRQTKYWDVDFIYKELCAKIAATIYIFSKMRRMSKHCRPRKDWKWLSEHASA